jgi:hypothetical protein
MMLMLIWNARKAEAWAEDDYAAAVALTASGHVAERQWSIARKHNINIGDRVFLMRQGRDRGLVASGHIVGAVFPDRHWDSSGTATNYVPVDWDTVLPVEDRLPVDQLKAQVAGVVWDRLQLSGTEAKPPADDEIEQVWAAHIGRNRFPPS